MTKHRWLKLSILVFFGFFCASARADLNLIVTPVSGGNRVRLGRVDTALAPQQEVRIRVNASGAEQYQVSQRLVNPLSNDKGDTLFSGAVLTYALPSSNSTGTLYAQNVEDLLLSDQLLYTSNPAGTGDAFTIVYSVDREEIKGAGLFQGTIQYTLRPVNGGARQTILVDISLEAEDQWTVHAAGNGPGGIVRVTPDALAARDAIAEISFAGNTGAIEIFQETEVWPEDEHLNPLPDDVVHFRAVGTSDTSLSQQADTPLTRARQRVYRSTVADDTVQIYFVIDEDVEASNGGPQAGRYKGSLRYVVDAEDRVQTFSVAFEVEIEPVFHLDVQLPAEGVRFSGLLPTSEPKFSEVGVRVQSNLGKPYVVTQVVASPLTNARGDTIGGDYFKMKGEATTGEPVAGQIIPADFAPVNSGEKTVYLSDAQGTPAQFKMIYRLRAFSKMKPGDYSTGITYSLEEK